MEEGEGALLPLACLEGGGVYRRVRHEGAPGLADPQVEELVMTLCCPRPHYDL